MNSAMLLVVKFNGTHIALIVTILLLMFVSAFFSACEFSFNSMSPIRIRAMAEKKVKGARRAIYISEHFDRTLTTVLVMNNVINILATTLCAYLFSDLIANDTIMNLLNTVVMTVIILIFTEILPKALVKLNPEKYACKLSGIMYFVIKVLSPIVIIFYGIQKLFTRNGSMKSRVTMTPEELEGVISTMQTEGVLKADEAQMLQGAFKVKDVTAHDIMTHRVDAVFLNVNASLEEVKEAFKKNQFSRMPVYQDNKDNVVGVLYIKDFFNSQVVGGGVFNLAKIMTKPLFISENANVQAIVKEMQQTKKNLAVVIDENGGVSGIVTMEDCVETVFGDFYDETDGDIEPILKQVGDDEYDLDADITVKDLFDRLLIEKLPKNPYQTLNSFLFERFDEIPEIGKKYEHLTIDETIDAEGNLLQNRINMVFTIKKMDGHRILKINLRLVYLDIEKKDNKSI